MPHNPLLKKTTRLLVGISVATLLSACGSNQHAGHDHDDHDHEGHDHGSHEGEDHGEHAEDGSVHWEALEHIDVVLHQGVKALAENNLTEAIGALAEIKSHADDLAGSLPQTVHNPLATKEALERFIALVGSQPDALDASAEELQQAFTDLEAIIVEVSAHSGMAHEH